MKRLAHVDSTKMKNHKRLVQLISEESEMIDTQRERDHRKEEILNFLIELQCRTSMLLI